MNDDLRKDAEAIYTAALREALPEEAVCRALRGLKIKEKLVLAAIGKAAWRMANAACGELGTQIESGIVITKYGHSQGEISNLQIFEAGHPLLDENGLNATNAVLDLIEKEKASGDKAVLFLVSGGGSTLFESLMPGITLEYMQALTSQLLACGATIQEMNVIRKLFSAVKGGRFAQKCLPLKIYQIVLSDVLGDDLAAIASGPAAPNPARAEDARNLNEKYSLGISEDVISLQRPVDTPNTTTVIAANVTLLCQSAARKAEELGYLAEIRDNAVDGDVEELAERIFKETEDVISDATHTRPCALIYGGEPTVHLKGNGRGGRNQELALLIAKKISGRSGIVFASCGSDGTDGPTNAAGGLTDGSTWDKISQSGEDPDALLSNNDSNRALSVSDSLIVTGPTGTNVNDVMIVLVK